MIVQLRLGAVEVAWEGNDMLEPGTCEVLLDETAGEQDESSRGAKALLDHVLAQPADTPWRDGTDGAECARGSLAMLILLCARLHRLFRLPLTLTRATK